MKTQSTKKTGDAQLLMQRRFGPLFWTQFCGAFNDNLYKNALVILITFKAYQIAELSSEQLVALCGGIFILPFFLFSALAGQISDQVSKSRLVVWIKVWEIGVMTLGSIGFVTGNFPLLIGVLFMMGLQSTFFGPAKYSALPELLPNRELVTGNAYVEMGAFLALFSLGVGIGSLLCEKLSFNHLELGLVPVGSFGISLFALDLFLVGQPTLQAPLVTVGVLLGTPVGWRITVDLLLFSLFSGFFIVPLYTLIQERSEDAVRSQTIAANNILNALFMVVGALLLTLLLAAGATLPQIFLVIALLNLAVAAYIYSLIPEFLYRFMCWILAHCLYRLRVQGRANIPLSGPAVLVCNHVTYVDWLIMASATQRPVRFVMHYSFLNIPLTGRIFRDAKVIPIAGDSNSPSGLVGQSVQSQAPAIGAKIASQ